MFDKDFVLSCYPDIYTADDLHVFVGLCLTQAEYDAAIAPAPTETEAV
ncbi:hypothetical protein [Lacticaseibacillus songhuajiangensis]|jgi:hypothetical protein|nr:hypothetical protein [Lacticaseibacillus songhuajiangensis]MCI1283147.1 hypothetical protein [Lacticaseibacillus songhuajiangensis]